MALSNTVRKRFRAIGHNLKPVVTIAQKGITENVHDELERALKDHELIKLKLVTANRSDKQALTESICNDFKAQCVQSIGHIVLLYRAAKNPDPRLSNLLRNRS